MVRVGGGWCALDEFLVKNDPCRGKYNIVQHLHYHSVGIQLAITIVMRDPSSLHVIKVCKTCLNLVSKTYIILCKQV